MKRLIIAGALLAMTATTAIAADITVFAAASMKGALDEIGAVYKAKTGNGLVVSYGSSATLAKQIEAAAPADIFISADEDWMDELASKKLIKPESRKDIAGNTLVLVSAAANKIAVKLDGSASLKDALGADKLALADVKSVPAGKYAKAALDKLGLWSGVEANVVMQDNVRSALALVAKGEAKLGIVYGSDAVSEPKVSVVATFDEATHAPIRYPAAVVAASQNADAAAFAAFLLGDEARAIFTKDGFTQVK
jgi:molybdate transport system substrate-binding protein